MTETDTVFLKCTRSHFQNGKELRFVCLMESCRANSLCCQECIKDNHEGHSKKQLQSLITIANFLKAKGPSNSQNPQNTTNRQNLLQIVQQNESRTIDSFKALRQSICTTLDKIQSNLQEYFQELKETIKKPHAQQDPIKVLESTLIEIKSGKNYTPVVKSIQRLLLLFNKVGKDGCLQFIQNPQDILEKIVAQSNKEITDLIDTKLSNINNILSQSETFIKNSTQKAQDLWESPLYSFTETLCHEKIQVEDSTKVVSGGDNIYQMAVMQPEISMHGSNQVFRFKINKLTSNWIAVGVGFQKIIEFRKFVFNPYDVNHGAFMISANGGVWAHEIPQLNNKVRSFKFEQGDIITCIVDIESKKIYFVKESDITDMRVKTRETFELSFAHCQYQPLHPCATIHYIDNSVEYIPATNTSQIPKYDYLFSSTLKHLQINVINNKSAMIVDNENLKDGYRACLLNKAVAYGNWNSTHHFSFRIVNSGEDWVSVGICQKSLVEQNQYKFNYESYGHGYYMISSNGGVWSSTDSNLNNKLACWKYKTGDVIECEVQLGDGSESPNNKIVFKKGKHKFVLPFQCHSIGKMYPCIMLHYIGDQVAVLPQF